MTIMTEVTTTMESIEQNVSERMLPPSQEEIKNTLTELAGVYVNSDTKDRQIRIGKAAVVFARQYGILPAIGINPEPSVEKGEIAFSDGSEENSETAVTTPYGNTSFALDVEIVAASGDKNREDDLALLHMALMREDADSNIGLRLVKPGILARIDSGVIEDVQTKYIEIYQSGQKTHQVEVDKDGYCYSAYEYRIDPHISEKRPTSASVIPTEVKEMNLTDNQLGQSSDEQLELKELLGRKIDINKLDGLARTVDTQGNKTSTDLKHGLNEVLNQNIF